MSPVRKDILMTLLIMLSPAVFAILGAMLIPIIARLPGLAIKILVGCLYVFPLSYLIYLAWRVFKKGKNSKL